MNRTISLLICSIIACCAVQVRNHGYGLSNFTKHDPHNWHESPYLNTRFLEQYDLVSQTLQEEGFQEGFFTTSDKLNINYLYLPRSQAEYTMIFCCGWLPGRKEGLASFYALMPQNCNMLFFDARGHGKSDGPLLSNFWEYGKKEYKDVIAAIRFAHEQSSKPIILFGICAGAFHAAHALITLEKNKKLADLTVAGLIFDSGWGSVSTSSHSAPRARIRESIASAAAHIYGSKQSKKHENNVVIRTISQLAANTYSVAHALLVRPLLYLNEKRTNLFDKIHQMRTPVFFIHAHDDEYTTIKDVKTLARLVERKKCWWITEPSSHASHHLKHKDEYRAQLCTFIGSCIKKDSLPNTA